MVGVAAGAGAGAGTGAGTGAVFGVGAGAAAFAVNTGENCGGPVFLDGFVFCLAFLPVAWSFASRSRRAGEPPIFEVGGMMIKVLPVVAARGSPRPLLVRPRRRADPSMSIPLSDYRCQHSN